MRYVGNSHIDDCYAVCRRMLEQAEGSRTMQVGALIIGDELLSGKRQDKHMQALIRILAARGMKLAWAEYLGDDPARIEAALRRAFAGGDLVFSFGGIGATPDDHTRACAAARWRAAGAASGGQGADRGTFRRGRLSAPDSYGAFPQGAAIIPNPVNQIAGFSHGHVHFLPGFPSMAWPMAEWVLDTHCRHLFATQPDVERSCIAIQAARAI
ncbi:CinA-like protein [Chromobacterium violaceum]|uniref:CinA-like protein n=1 Tax=Chromobacterium violaceum TaxID=536 RepID=A0A447TCD5_CHRVL|nr:CinA-like protein [Chromobacterium violaceum]